MESAFEVFISVFRATNAALVTVVDRNTDLKTYVQLGDYLSQGRDKPDPDMLLNLSTTRRISTLLNILLHFNLNFLVDSLSNTWPSLAKPILL